MKTLSKLVSIAAITFVFAGGCVADASSDPAPDEAAGEPAVEVDLTTSPTGSSPRPDFKPSVAALPAEVCGALRDNWLNGTDNCDSAWSVYNRYCR